MSIGGCLLGGSFGKSKIPSKVLDTYTAQVAVKFATVFEREVCR